MADTTTAARTATPEARTAPRLSPKVRRLLRHHGLQATDVVTDDAHDRVTAADVERAVLHRRGSDGTGPRPTRPATTPRGPDDQHARTDTVQLSPTRRALAERMHRSLRTTAQLTAVVAVDMTHVMNARASVEDAVQQRTGVALTPLAPTARAVCNVLARHPVLNATIDLGAGTATYRRDVHLGIAVDTAHGLVVPTIRGAQDLTVTALAARIADLVRRARAQDLSPDELTGGTFTITGSRGVVLDTPILNPPQVGILATTLIEKRPVVVTDELGGDTLAIRQMSNLCLTYDHRLVDGADAARFLTDLKHQLETVDLLAGVA